MNPKILYASFDTVPSPKGASTHIIEFVKRLGAEFGNVVLLTPNENDGFDPDFLPGVQHVEVECVDDNPIGRARLFRIAVEEVLSKQPFSIIHFRSIFAGMAACRSELNRGAALIYEANGFPSVEMKSHYPAIASQRSFIEKLRSQELHCLRKANQIITVSETTANFVSARLGDQQKEITTIPNGASMADFVYRDPPTVDGPLEILYVGTASPWQGLGVLLEAVAAVNRQRPCRLTILGPPNRRRNRPLNKRIEKLGIADLINWYAVDTKPEVNNAFHQAHLTVAPLLADDRNCLQGCCPIKIIEAMASGCPLIASDLPVVREIAVPEDHFLPARQGDVDNLKNRILELASNHDLATRLAQAARSQYESRLTWAAATNTLVSVYEKLLTSVDVV